MTTPVIGNDTAALLTIYVRRKRIVRRGIHVEGWQAGFSPNGGGSTGVSKEEAITAAKLALRSCGYLLKEIVEL